MKTLADTLVRLLTTAAILVAVWLVCRSVLPRLPQYLFRGRLRIRRVGLRGIRGLEWSSKGFLSSRSRRKDAQGRRGQDAGHPRADRPVSLQSHDHPDALVVRIAHIYLQLQRRDERHRSWATLHIHGLGIRLPRASQHELNRDGAQASHQHAKYPRRSSTDAVGQQNAAEREEERLQRLMFTPPTSPGIRNRSTLTQRRSSVSRARASTTTAATAPTSAQNDEDRARAPPARPQLPARPFSSLIPNTSASSFRTIPLYAGWLIYAYLRDSLWPRIQTSISKLIRLALVVLSSTIPLVSSLFEVEIHRLEIYVQEAETVLRVGRLGAQYSMKVVSARRSRHHGSPERDLQGHGSVASNSTSMMLETPAQGKVKSGHDKHASDGRYVGSATRTSMRGGASVQINGGQKSLTEMLAEMPTRIGSGAKGAAAFVMAGVPAANGSLRVTVESIQVFDALFVTETAKAPRRQDVGKAKDFFYHPPAPSRSATQPGHVHADFSSSSAGRTPREGSSTAATINESGENGIQSPFQTTASRWFETKPSKGFTQAPLSELLASPTLPRTLPPSSSVQSVDRDASDRIHDFGSVRMFSDATPTLYQSLGASRQSSYGGARPTEMAEAAGPAHESLSRTVEFADGFETPPSMSRHGSRAGDSRTIKRSSSTSKLNTMNTLSLSGFTDRWADWALEPIANSDLSSDTGWARSALEAMGLGQASAKFSKTVPDSARLLSLPGLSTVKVNFALGPSMQIRQREAVHLGVEMAETSVGLVAVAKVVELVKERRQKFLPQSALGEPPHDLSSDDEVRLGSQQSCELRARGKRASGKSASSNAAGRRALARLGSVNILLPKMRITNTMRPGLPPSNANHDMANRQGLAPGIANDVYLETVLQMFRFELRTSDHSDPEHQQWLGTCGFRNYRRSRSGTEDAPRQQRRGSLLGGGRSKSSLRAVEHRRVFHVESSLLALEIRSAISSDLPSGTSTGLSCGPKSDEIMSDLAVVRNLKLKLKSSWTPFGLMPSLRAVSTAIAQGQQDPSRPTWDIDDPSLMVEPTSSTPASGGASQLVLPGPNCPFAFFASDPNEQAVILEADVGQISSYAKVNHVAALIGAIAASKAARAPQSQAIKKERSVPLPRLAVACSVRDLSLRVDASELPGPSTGPEGLASHGHRGLVVATPLVEFVFHGTYKDAYAQRNSDHRRAGWRLFRRGETRFRQDDLGWTQYAPSPQAKGLSVGAKAGQRAVEPSGAASASEQTSDANGANQSPAAQSTTSDGLADPFVSTSRGQAGRDAKVRTAHSGSIAHLYEYDIESNCRIDSVEAYYGFRKEPILKSRLAATVPSGADLPPYGMSHQHIFSLHHIDVDVRSMVPAGSPMESRSTFSPRVALSRAATELAVRTGTLSVDLWDRHALGLTRELAQAFTDALPVVKHRGDHTSGRQGNSALDALPGGLYLFAHVGHIIINLGGSDGHCEADLSRGVSVRTKEVTFEYVASKDDRFKGYKYGTRSSISLPEDIRVNANASAVQGPAAIARLLAIGFEVIPLLDAERAAQTSTSTHTAHWSHTHDGSHSSVQAGNAKQGSMPTSESRSATLFMPAVWDFQKTKQRLLARPSRLSPPKQKDANNYIVKTNLFNLTAICRGPRDRAGPVQVKIDANNDDKLNIKVEMLHTYCLLLTASSLMSLLPKRRTANGDSGKGSNEASRDSAAAGAKDDVRLAVTYELPKVDMMIALPNDTNVFMHLHRLKFDYRSAAGLEVLWDTLVGAVESARVPATNLWEEALRLRKWRIMVSPATQDGPVGINISGISASLRIPTDFQFHNVIEYSTVAFKATKQLIHQFIRRSAEVVINPVAEDPKRVPNIKIRLQLLTVEAEDDPIETRLNLIWRAGSSEQRRRMEREQTFEETAAEISAAERGKSSISLATSVTADVAGSDAESVLRQAEARSVTIEQARRRLDMFNESEWIRRHTSAKREQERREEMARVQMFGSQSLESFDLPIKVTRPSLAAPLLRSVMTHVQIEVSRPSFPLEELADFLHLHGDGIPKSTRYSTVIPLHLRLRLGEWRISLRDYPLPLVHVAPVDPDKPDNYSLDLAGDICLAEQLGGPQSIRHVPAIIVPASTGREDAVEYRMQVPKMVIPLKFYGSPSIEVRTPFPTRIIWGQSLQPAIHDVQRVIESITSPPHDPSPRLPFWDKIPFLLHGQYRIKFSGQGNLHFFFKGSRDPYEVTGRGAGWVMCWQDDVEVRIGFDNPDREFFQVISTEYLLAIPDFQEYLDSAACGQASVGSEGIQSKDKDAAVTGSHRRFMIEPRFQKVCLRLSNGVRWGAGLIYERTCTKDTCKRRPICQGTPFYRECRFWDRIPHWEVMTKSRQGVEKVPESERSDSFAGWRSHHIHPSLSIYSPREGIIGYGPDRKRDGATNSLYFSPLAWEHFWRWIALFSSALSLPTRQGRLFPNTSPQSAKLSAFVATIKYRFHIEPLFVSHFYQQASKADVARGTTSLVGVKARVNSLRADLHQRQEETVKERPELGERGSKLKVFHKPFNEAEVDCAGIDLRTIWARFSDANRQLVDDVDFDAEADVNEFPDAHKLSDDEEPWYDIADYAELDWTPPSRPDPELSINQTMVCPRFHYYRKVESKRERRARQATLDQEVPSFTTKKGQKNGEDVSIDSETTPISQLAYSKFGNEHTHSCLVGTSPTSPEVQSQLAQDRLSYLEAELDALLGAREHERTSPSDGDAADHETEHRIVDLKTKIQLVKGFMQSLRQLSQNGPNRSATGGTQMFIQSSSDDRLDLRALYRDWETFHNRFFCHNPIIYFSTDTRNALLKYYLCSRMRKAYAHHMTAKAVCYVRNLRSTPSSQDRKQPQRPDLPAPGEHSGFDLKGFLYEKMQFVMAETPRLEQGIRSLKQLSDQPEPRRGLSDAFTINKSNVAVLLKPQIVLQAKGPVRSSIIITAKRLRLQNYSVLEDRFPEDELNARLMYRNFLALDSLQAFAPTHYCQYLRTTHHNTKFAYVPLETLIDDKYQTRDFDRIISSTDAVAGYDKFNRLRVNDSDRIIVPEDQVRNPEFDHLLHHMDFIQVRCPRIALSADSNHFAAIYTVVTDLLLYRDPVSRDHSKRLEEMLFNYDFENLDALSEVLTGLQTRVRHARDLLSQYNDQYHLLNKEGKADLYLLNVETMDMIDDLDLLMRAMTTARDHRTATDNDKKSALRLKATADELGWYMMGLHDGEQLAKLSIRNASFSWLNRADSSTSNTLSIGDLQALNVRPDAHFAEIISKYSQASDHLMAKKGLFLLASWRVLAPVGGIPIIEDFELSIHPIRLSIELKVGRDLMDYIFGSKRRQLKDDPQPRITEVKDDQSTTTAKTGTDTIKPKKKGLFTFFGGSKSKETAASSRLAVPASNESRPSSRSAKSSQRRARSSSREPRPRPDERRRSLDDPRSRSRTRERGRLPSERDQDRGAASSDEEDASDNDAQQQREIARRNADSMRRRASTNRTFVNVKFAETVLCLSYKGDKQKSITDLFDLVFRAPTLEYRNQTCGYEDLVNFCKKDIFRAAWDQRTSLLKGILHRPRKTSRNMRDLATQGIGSAVGRITGQERPASLRGEGLASRSKEGSGSALSLSTRPSTSIDDDEDDDEDADADDDDEDDDDDDADEEDGLLLGRSDSTHTRGRREGSESSSPDGPEKMSLSSGGGGGLGLGLGLDIDDGEDGAELGGDESGVGIRVTSPDQALDELWSGRAGHGESFESGPSDLSGSGASMALSSSSAAASASGNSSNNTPVWRSQPEFPR